jgi:hypothetical protein
MPETPEPVSVTATVPDVAVTPETPAAVSIPGYGDAPVPVPESVVEPDVPEDTGLPFKYEKPITKVPDYTIAEMARRGINPLFAVNASVSEIDELVQAYNLDAAIASNDDAVIRGLSPKAREVYDSLLVTGKLTAVYEAMYGSIKERKDAQWTQTVKFEDKRIAPSVNAIKEGSSSLDVIASAAGIHHGRSRIVPLYNTGIWVELSSPTPNEWVLLKERISQEKLDMALRTSGVSLSNNDVYQRAAITNFLLEHVVWTTAPNKDLNYLKSIIQVTDYIPLTAYMAGLVYPTGYDYMYQCKANPYKCTHVENKVMDILRTVWNDFSMLSERQLRLLSSRKVLRHEDIMDYQSDFDTKVSPVLSINDNLQIRFRIPSLSDAEDEGMAWITDMQTRTNEAFGRRLDGDQRNDFLRRMAIADRLVTYAHFIESIVGRQGEHEAVEVDRERISDILRALGQEEDIANKISEFRRTFVFNRQVSICGTVKEPCSACGAHPPKEEYSHADLITLDPVYLFTTLLDRRVEELLTPR